MDAAKSGDDGRRLSARLGRARRVEVQTRLQAGDVETLTGWLGRHAAPEFDGGEPELPTAPVILSATPPGRCLPELAAVLPEPSRVHAYSPRPNGSARPPRNCRGAKLTRTCSNCWASSALRPPDVRSEGHVRALRNSTVQHLRPPACPVCSRSPVSPEKDRNWATPGARPEEMDDTGMAVLDGYRFVIRPDPEVAAFACHALFCRTLPAKMSDPCRLYLNADANTVSERYSRSKRIRVGNRQTAGDQSKLDGDEVSASALLISARWGTVGLSPGRSLLFGTTLSTGKITANE